MITQLFHRSWIWLLAVGLMASSCIKEPEIVDIQSIKFTGQTDTLLNMEVVVVVDNPNGMGAKVLDIDSKAYFGDTFIGTSKSKQEFKLKAKDTTAITFISQVNLPSLARLYPELLESDSAMFRIVGDYEIKAWFKSFKIHREQEGLINARQEIRRQISMALGDDNAIALRNITMRSLPNLRETELAVDVEMANDFPFNFTLSDMELDFYLDPRGRSVGSWKMGDPVVLESLSKGQIPVKVTLANASLLSGLGSVLLRGKKEITAKGTATVTIGDSRFELPIDQTKAISLSQLLNRRNAVEGGNHEEDN